jgi:hypothetical protein
MQLGIDGAYAPAENSAAQKAHARRRVRTQVVAVLASSAPLLTPWMDSHRSKPVSMPMVTALVERGQDIDISLVVAMEGWEGEA